MNSFIMIVISNVCKHRSCARWCVYNVWHWRVNVVATFISFDRSGGAGKARFNVATPTYEHIRGSYATVTCTAYVLPYNFQTKSI